MKCIVCTGSFSSWPWRSRPRRWSSNGRRDSWTGAGSPVNMIDIISSANTRLTLLLCLRSCPCKYTLQYPRLRVNIPAAPPYVCTHIYIIQYTRQKGRRRQIRFTAYFVLPRVLAIAISCVTLAGYLHTAFECEPLGRVLHNLRFLAISLWPRYDHAREKKKT